MVKRIALPLAILQSHKAIPIPITHKGGSSDAAIATHATDKDATVREYRSLVKEKP